MWVKFRGTTLGVNNWRYFLGGKLGDKYGVKCWVIKLEGKVGAKIWGEILRVTKYMDAILGE